MIGKTISHYKILEKIGEGGMGVVYKAGDQKLKRIVAIKFLPPELNQDPEAKERFLQEAQAAAALDHSNICTVHEIDETKGQNIIVMAYIKGESLKARITRGPLDINETIDIAIQVAEGLQEAHSKGIIHRDIKPANIMLTEKGQAKIMDFGLAKLEWGADLTKTATVMGTAAYMSPEQAQGATIDHRTDIWSLGTVLFEMLAGELPFKGSHHQAVIYSILNKNPEPITNIIKDIPIKLARIVYRFLEKNPRNRYKDMDTVLADLKSIDLKHGSPSFTEKPSIAVLPFINMSADSENEYFSDGLAEELINALTKIKDLHVLARTSSFSFKGKDEDIREIGKRLNVKTVLEGSVRKAGNRVRITAQLINVVDGFHLWSERYDREMADIFMIQDEIASKIVNKLKMKLMGLEMENGGKSTKNLEAYDAYLRGRYCLNKFTNEWVNNAISYFQETVTKDPNYAPAYAALAEAYQRQSALGVLPSKEAVAKTRTAAQQALHLNPNLAEAHFALAMIAGFHKWDRTAAEESFKRALELNPNFAKAFSWYAIFLMSYERKYQAALDLIAQAEKLDPLELQVKAHRGWIYCFQRRFDDAINLFKNLINLEPNFAHGHYWLGCSYLYKEFYDEAIKEIEKAIALGGRPVFQIGMLGVIHACAGNKTKAKEVAAELKALSKQGSGFSWVARVYASLGEKDRVFEWLEKAYEEHDPSLTYIAASPELESVYSEPRFKALLKKMGLEQ